MKKERSKKHRRLQLLRIAIQAFFLGLFFYLLFGTHFTGEDYIGPVEAFFHFSPLLAAATMLAARTLIVFFGLAAVTVVVTLLLGRVACGWVCPLGTIHQFFSWAFKKSKFLRPKKPATGGLWVKYAILAFVLVAALFSLNVAGYFDPISFLTRVSATSLVPAASHGLQGVVGLVYAVKLEGLGDKLAQSAETLTLNSTFVQGFAIGLIFLAFLLLNKWRERFWCRYICPLGALLGFFGRLNLFKLKIDEGKCTKCNLCSIHCPTQASPFPNDQWKSSECIYCETCAAICPTKAITFPVRFKQEKAPAVDFTRRRVMASSLLALFSVPFFRISMARKRASEKLLRPPGSLPEPDFLRRCVKCGECMKACPTNGLQPVLAEAGPEGIVDSDTGPENRVLRILLFALHPGLPDRGDQGAVRSGKDRREDRDGLDQQEPLYPLLSRPAVHRLRRALPRLAQGDQIHRGRNRAARRDDRGRKGAGHRRRALHRLRHLRKQVPGDGPAGDLRHLGRRGPVQGKPAPPPSRGMSGRPGPAVEVPAIL